MSDVRSPVAHGDSGRCASSRGRRVPDSLLGELRDSPALLDTPGPLRERLAEDGYLFLRGALEVGES